MNRNDMRSVVYLIIALICFYYLIDDFFGKNKISTWVDKFIGDFGGTAAPVAEVVDPATAPAAAPAKAKTQPQTDTGKIKIPAPEIDTGKIKIPQPEGAPKTKTGTSGLSLPDLFHGFNPFPIGIPALAAESAAVTGAFLTLPQTLARMLP